MGLFNNRRSSQRDSAWKTQSFHANTSDEKKVWKTQSFHANTSDHGRMESFMSHQETATVSTGCDTSSGSSDDKGDGAPTSKDILTMKIKLLERQLKQRDETISHLRTAMEGEDERVALLERQLGCLVELSRSQIIDATVKEEPPMRRCASSGTDGRVPRRPSLTLLPDQREAEMEISALQQLLARVIAEKDRLGYENGNLKNFIKDQLDAAVVCPKCAGASASSPIKRNMPSTIEDLDNHLEEKERAMSFHHHQDDDSLGGTFDYQPKPKKSISFHHGNEEYCAPKKSISFHHDNGEYSKPKKRLSWEEPKKRHSDNHLEERETSFHHHQDEDSLEGSSDHQPPKKSISFHHGNEEYCAPKKSISFHHGDEEYCAPKKSISFHHGDEEYCAPKKSISFHEDYSKPKKRHSSQEKEVAKSKSFHHGESRATKSSVVSPNKQISLPVDYSRPEVVVEEPQEQASIMYQMSCRSCSDTHPDLKYMSSWITTGSPNETKKELIRVLKTHYRQVWYLVQEQNIDGSCHSDISSIQDEEFNNDFEHSSLAKHLAKHCELCETEEMVMKWCMKNIRVEIQKNTISGDDNEGSSEDDNVKC